MLLLQKFKISGHSMEPTILSGEYVIASGLSYLFKNPKLNDIVVFNKGSKILVKRIFKIQKNKYFVIGDNKKDSLDGKNLGYISKSQILGKVIFKF